MMSGSTVTNQRRHIGLQKLTALATLTHTLVGPNKRHKFIHDKVSGDSVLVCSSYRLLQNLDLGCSVGQLLSETIQAHQRVYHSGTTCLVFVAGSWSRAVLECLHRDIAIPHILSAMSEGLEICLNTCRRHSISMEDAVQSAAAALGASDSVLAGPRGSPLPGPQTPALAPSTRPGQHGAPLPNRKNKPGNIKLTHSRHFCSNDEADTENSTQRPLPPSSPSSPSSHAVHVDVASAARAVSHGGRMGRLVVEACALQAKNTGNRRSCAVFDVSKLMTCLLPGLSEDHARVVPGCIVQLSDEQASVVHGMKEQWLKVALINGDLCENYRHLGFTKPSDLRLVADKLDGTGPSKEDEWIGRVLTTLLKLDVSLVLVNGVVNNSLVLQCVRRCILVIDRMKPAVLKDFAETTGAVPVTYATQLNTQCVGTGAQVRLRRDLGSNGRKTPMAVNIATRQTTLVTVILTSCVPSTLPTVEEQFWGCAYRLHHALRDRKLLPGAGEIELRCLHQLQKHIENNSQQRTDMAAENPYRETVLQLMGEAWTDFISAAMVNSGQCSKVEAWSTITHQLKLLDEGLCVETAGLFRSHAEEGPGSSEVSSDGPTGRIYDVVSVKMEAWRRALDLVFLVLLSDTEIITGTDPTSAAADDMVL